MIKKYTWRCFVLCLVVLGLAVGAGAWGCSPNGADPGTGQNGMGSSNPPDSVVWQVDNLQTIGTNPSYNLTVVGAPMVIDTPAGKAVQFNGVADGGAATASVGDALFVPKQPIDGWAAFTAEVIFRPDIGGAQAQRWFHMTGPNLPNGDRLLFEIRLDAATKTWFLVSFVQDQKGAIGRLYGVAFPHPVGPWYHVAIVVDGKTMKHYVNGVYENAGPCVGDAGEGCTTATAPNLTAPWPLAFAGIGPGGTSLGCRYTKVAFLKGAIRLARFTPRALTPAEFIPPP
jgi:hypothetical protein